MSVTTIPVISIYFCFSLRRIRAFTNPLHLSLSLATLVASVHDWSPRPCLSLLKVLLQVSFGGPLSFTIRCPWEGYYLCAHCCPFSIHVPTISTLINNCTILISGICCVKLYTLMVKDYTETFRRGTFITVSGMRSAGNMENME